MAKPIPRAYHAALGDFASGRDSPSAFLERCLATLAEIEPQVLAFVHYDAAAAREAARDVDGALASGQAALADRRHAGRRQRHHRDR